MESSGIETELTCSRFLFFLRQENSAPTETDSNNNTNQFSLGIFTGYSKCRPVLSVFQGSHSEIVHDTVPLAKINNP